MYVYSPFNFPARLYISFIHLRLVWGVLPDHADLREHAIFTLRNLLHGNLENQAVVDAIKPVGRWDEYGVLQDIQKSQ